MTAPIKTVALLGADGTLGPAVLDALLAHNFKVTVLKRASSRSPSDYPSKVRVVKIPDEFAVEGALTDALRGQDAVVVTIKGTQTALQKRLAEAAVRAGVRRFVPADFGSCDSASPTTQHYVPLYKNKTELREYLQRLADENAAFSWTSLVCGHFFDWDLKFIHVYLSERRAHVLDGGDKKFSISTLSRVGDATARILLNPDATANKMLYVQSFCVNQNQIVAAFEKATGGSKWDVTVFDSEAYVEAQKAKADAGDHEANEDVVWYLGTIDADWRSRDGFAMKALGLEDEDLDDVVGRVVREQP